MSQVKRHLHIGQVTVPYVVEWSGNRSSIGLSLDQSMELTVKAPHSATEDDIEAVLDSRKEWILRKLAGLEEQADPPRQKEFLSGEKLPYNGRRYRLSVHEGDGDDPSIEFDGSTFTLEVPAHLEGRARTQAITEALIDWYTRRAHQELPARVEKYADKLDVEVDEVAVGDLDGNWGEYHQGRVSLHYRLLFAPTDIQDYVVVHELAHQVHGDHSERFWNLVGTVIPDYERRREWLRVNGNSLQV